jgi:hypothetical protein
MNSSGGWVNLSTHLGEGSDMSNFEAVTIGVPLDAYHSGFRLRFSNTATAGNYDDWFVDDVRVDWGPEVSASPASFSHNLVEGDSVFDELVVANAGPGGLTYSIDVVPDLSATLFGGLLQAGQVNPAVYDYGYLDGALPPLPVKGGFEGDPGPEVLFDAGGPDGFGYFWIDSDEPNGPPFAWVDVLATGTDASGGLDDDNYVGPFPIGFTFPYYDGFYSEFYIGSNGLIGFGPPTSYASLSNTSIPATAAPNNIIAWCWDDLDPTDLIDAEIILHPDGSIVLQYREIGAGFDLLSASVGIEDEAGANGLQVVHNAAYLHDSLAIEFVRPAQWLTLASYGGNLAAAEADTIDLQFGSAELYSGYYKSNIEVHSNDPYPGYNPRVIPAELWVGGSGPTYVCGDADGNELVNISDAIYLIDYIFVGGPAPDPYESGDVNCDATVNVTDATYIIAYIFGGGPAPCAECP